jgi:hypothetical protein
MRPIVILALVCMSALAAADDDVDIDESANPLAVRFVDEGRQAYERHDFAGARVSFEAARNLWPLPELDYDLARCWDQLGHGSEAVAEYRRYLVAMPNAPNAGVVRARIAALEHANASASSEHRRLVAPIAVGGAAVAGAVIAAALVGSVAPEYDHLKQVCQGACTRPQWSGLEARADAGYALFAVAGALAVADGVLWLLTYRHDHREHAVPLAVPAASSSARSLFELRF